MTVFMHPTFRYHDHRFYWQLRSGCTSNSAKFKEGVLLMVGSENFEIPFVSSKNPNLTKAIRFVFLRYNSPLIREVTLAGIIYIYSQFICARENFTRFISCHN